VIAALAALALLLPAAETGASPAAPVTPAPEEHFEALVAEIASLRSELDGLDRREQGAIAELDRLGTESELLAREVERLDLQRARAERDLASSRLALEEARRSVAAAESKLSARLRQAYTMGRQREVRVLLALSEPVDLLRGLAYLDVMARRQSGLLESVRRSRAETEALESTQAARVESLAAVAERKKEKAAQLQEVRRHAREVLDSTRKEGDAHRNAIAELTRAAEDLEQAIVASRGLLKQNEGGADAGTAAPPGPPRIDIDRLRGAMEWPVEGTIAVPFGDIRHPRFKTVTPHPGIDITAEPRAAIRAVLGGRVVFSRRFSGYGNTVLVDHGDGYLSVYARAAVLSVSEGQDVVLGQVLGHAAEEAFDGGRPTVYFEFRHGGEPVDPAQWLKRSGDRRREAR